MTATESSIGQTPTHSASTGEALLSVNNLSAELVSGHSHRPLLSDVSLTVREGEVVGLLGETGAGKSLTAWSILGVLDPRIRVSSGQVWFGGIDLCKISAGTLRSIRGRDIALIAQNPVSALDPVRDVGFQLANLYRVHSGGGRRAARQRATEVLESVGLRSSVLASYPHELSGGMAQRVVIAMALINRAKLLIADEPTTGLDVTVQAEVLDLIRAIVDANELAVLMVTHDLGVVANYCDRVSVMYGGRVVEASSVETLFDEPVHPYTRSLIEASRGAEANDGSLGGLALPNPADWSTHCAYAPRCGFAAEVCRSAVPTTRAIAPSHLLACHQPWLRRDNAARSD